MENREVLRAAQAPLKAEFRERPEAALVTLHAAAQLGEGVSCSVQTGQALVEAGLHPATGGTGMQACSGDMLLQALAACAGVTLSAVATSTDIPVTSGSVRVEGDLDFSGTLGVNKTAPVGFTDIRVTFDLISTATEEQIATLCQLTERYCVVFQTLATSPNLSFAIEQSRAETN
ncbi:MAG: OsmC family protein [Candidatus Nanopelagicales bacterium]